MKYLVLVYAHLLGDYPLQGQFLAQTKGDHAISLASHAAIWTGTVMTAGRLVGYEPTVVDAVWLFATHAAADFAKAKPVGLYKRLPESRALALDQGLHLLQLAVYWRMKR